MYLKNSKKQNSCKFIIKGWSVGGVEGYVNIMLGESFCKHSTHPLYLDVYDAMKSIL